MSAPPSQADLLRLAYKAHYRACTQAQYYRQPTPIAGGACEHCDSRYVMLGGYALGVYRMLDNGKLKQLEQWPHAIKD